MSAATSRPPFRVLVVDDDRDTVYSLCTLLELWGYEVARAADGHAALEAACKYSPDVVLLDMRIPGLDGYKVASQLKEIDQASPPLLVVAVSGLGMEEERKRALAAGCDRFLLKPADPDELKTLLDDAREGRLQQTLAS
jgi:CheY-like chemotaxis protein